MIKGCNIIDLVDMFVRGNYEPLRLMIVFSSMLLLLCGMGEQPIFVFRLYESILILVHSKFSSHIYFG